MSHRPDNHMKFNYMLAGIIAGGLLLMPCGCKSKNKPGVSRQPAAPSAVVTPSEEPKIAAKPRHPAGEQFYEWALNGDLKNIQAELDNAVDVNSTNPEGRSAIMLAAFNGHTEIVDLLITQGGKVNHQDQEGRTALMYAASGDNLPTVQLLLARQAKVNIIDGGEKWTALMFAAAEGQTATVKTLLDHGANWKMVDVDGESARDFAANKNHTETVNVLDTFAKSQTSKE